MKNIICRTLILSAVALAAPAAIAQQAQDPNAPPTGANPALVITPQGSFSVRTEGSLQPIDPSLGIVSTPDGIFTVQPDGSFQPANADAPASDAPQPAAPNNGMKTMMPPGASRTPPTQAQIMQAIAQQQQQQQQQRENSLRDALACTDQEWAVLIPKIRNIQTLQAAIIPGSPVRVPKAGGDAPSVVTQLGNRVQQFHDVTSNKDATSDQVTHALTAVRGARNNVKTTLNQARRELTDLLTPKQEATLFERGILAD